MSNPIVAAWAAFDRITRKKRRHKARRTLHRYVRRERKKKPFDLYGRHY